MAKCEMKPETFSSSGRVMQEEWLKKKNKNDVNFAFPHL